MQAQSPNHWTARKFPNNHFLQDKYFSCIFRTYITNILVVYLRCQCTWLKLFIYFNWRLITSQYCVICHTLTWISHGVHVSPQPEHHCHFPSHPSMWVVPEHQLWVPASCIRLALVICFRYGNIHVSVLFSQIVLLSLSPTLSESLFFTCMSLLLSCIQGLCYCLSKFHIYAFIYCVGVLLSDLLHSV